MRQPAGAAELLISRGGGGRGRVAEASMWPPSTLSIPASEGGGFVAGKPQVCVTSFRFVRCSRRIGRAAVVVCHGCRMGCASGVLWRAGEDGGLGRAPRWNFRGDIGMQMCERKGMGRGWGREIHEAHHRAGEGEVDLQDQQTQSRRGKLPPLVPLIAAPF